MSHDCNGCKCFKQFSNKTSCQYTQIQYIHIPGCPCKECLVKVICNTICADLVYVLERRLEIRDPYRSERVGNVKENIMAPHSWGSMSSSISSFSIPTKPNNISTIRKAIRNKSNHYKIYSNNRLRRIP